MNASGYADLLAKSVAGADWILADAAGDEPIEPATWATVQDSLPSWVDSPAGVARGDLGCLQRLVVGLLMSGFAMQRARSSRPASGAEHQFSHLWDMQHHTHNGAPPFHGFKVGIGTLASLALYEVLLRRDLERLDVDDAVARWPSFAQCQRSHRRPAWFQRTGCQGTGGDPGEVPRIGGIACATRSPSRRMAHSPRAADHAPAAVPKRPRDASRGGLPV